VRKDLHYGSDHFPVSTEIALDLVEAPLQRQRNWKRLDTTLVEAEAQKLQVLAPTQLNSTESIDHYAAYLATFAQELIEKAVL